MAHHIAQMADGRDAIAYVGETPWHGKGQKLSPGQSIEIWAKEAGLDFHVAAAQGFFEGTDVNGETFRGEVPNRVALYRTDTRKAFGFVSETRYAIVQPRDILNGYEVITKGTDFELEVAGVLKGGQRVWALARHKAGGFRILGQDEVKPYLLLATSYADDMATVAAFSTIRTVCWNTLHATLAEQGLLEQQKAQRKAAGEKNARQPKFGVRVPHFQEFNPESVRERLGMAEGIFKRFEEQANVLARRSFSEAEAAAYFTKVLGSYNDKGELTTQSKNLIEEVVIPLYKRGPGAGFRSANDTAWGAVNAVTRLVDHESRARDRDTRLEKAWFGKGDELKQKALREALELAA